MPKYNWSKATREQLETLAQTVSEAPETELAVVSSDVTDAMAVLSKACTLRTRAEVDADIVRAVRNARSTVNVLTLSLLADEPIDVSQVKEEEPVSQVPSEVAPSSEPTADKKEAEQSTLR